MYELLSIDVLSNHQKNHTPLTEGEFTLKDLLVFYQSELMPYKYTYECEHGLKVSFKFNKDNLCHLIFGTINNPSWKKKYSGNKGYLGIESGDIEFSNLPPELKKKALKRGGHLILIKTLLKKPSIIHFNKNLVEAITNQETIKDVTQPIRSKIDAKYLLDKSLKTGDHIHLFLKDIGGKNLLVPNSFFPNDKDNYIQNQLSFKVLNCIFEQLPNIPTHSKAI